MIFVADINDARIQVYRSLREQSQSPGTSLLTVAEGEKVALKALHSSCELVSVYALEEYYDRHAALIEASGIPGTMRFTSSRELMTEIVGFSMHQGMLVCVRQPPNPLLEELTFPMVALDGLADSENVGAIVRNCVAFGVQSLIVDSATANPWLRRSVRVSMGSIFQMRIHRCDSLATVLKDLRDSAYCALYAAETSMDAEVIGLMRFREPSLIVFGSEGHGISSGVLSLCDAVVRIPTSTSVDSLNVGAASAVILSQLFSQRSAL